jgi:hypothetical protein
MSIFLGQQLGDCDEAKLGLAEILLGIFLTIGIFATGYSVSSSRHSPTDRASGDEQRQITDFSDALLAIWDYLTRDAITIFTLFLAIATIWLAYSTRQLWIASEKQLRVTQRSHIAVEPQGVIPLYCDPHTVAHISIKNVGGVPARKIRWFVDLAFDPIGIRSDFPIDESRLHGDNVLPPGILMNFSQNFCATGEEVAAIQGNAAYCFVWGIVRYTDVFGGDRFTRFCHRYNKANLVVVDGKEGLSAKRAKYHQWGNDADERE